MSGLKTGIRGRSLLAASVAAAIAAGVAAQQQGGMMKEVVQTKLAAIKQSQAANQAALRQYTWTETAQFALNGEVKGTKQLSCRYGPDGKVAKTPIGPPPEQPKMGPLKRRVAEHKKEEISETMEAVKAVIGLYVPPDGQKMEQSFQAGNASLDRPGAGEAGLAFRNYAKPGDSMALDFNMGTKKLAGLNVNSYTADPSQPVSLVVQFATLPDGTSYPASEVINASAQGIQVTITNSNYQKLGP
jgi:hypothetical protein